MEEDKQTLAIHRVKPPRSSFSTVMNSIGNWTMIGTMPFVIGESLAQLQGKHLSPTMLKANLALLATGVGIGAFFGFKETKDLDEYRDALVKDIEKLHARTQGKS